MFRGANIKLQRCSRQYFLSGMGHGFFFVLLSHLALWYTHCATHNLMNILGNATVPSRKSSYGLGSHTHTQKKTWSQNYSVYAFAYVSFYKAVYLQLCCGKCSHIELKGASCCNSLMSLVVMMNSMVFQRGI